MLKALRFYDDLDYSLKRRARFVFYINIAALILTIAALFSTAYLHVLDPRFANPNLIVLLPIFVGFFSFLYCLRALVKGDFNLSANLLVVTALVVTWAVMFVDNNVGVSKMNTIVFVVGILALLPLVVNSSKRILIYGLVNLLTFFLFVAYAYQNRENYNITSHEVLDTLVDTTFVLIFTMLTHYYVFSINNTALKNANDEIVQRKKIAAELEYHKGNLEFLVREKTNDLESLNEELQAQNETLNNKNEIIQRKNITLDVALKDLKEMQSRLVQAEKMTSLGVLTSGVAHEINNPLNYLMRAYVGLTQYFEEHESVDKGKTDPLLDSVNTGVKKISSIVNQLGQFSDDDDHFDADCNIPSIIDNCLVMLRNKYKTKPKIEKKHTVNSLLLKGNVGKLHQMFFNVLNNAFYAIKEDGEISITTKVENARLLVEISDNGQGISPEHLKQVADPFFTTKPPGDGVGLGLYIVYSVLNEHNGLMEVVSEENEGTKVIISLPMVH